MEISIGLPAILALGVVTGENPGSGRPIFSGTFSFPVLTRSLSFPNSSCALPWAASRIPRSQANRSSQLTKIHGRHIVGAISEMLR